MEIFLYISSVILGISFKKSKIISAYIVIAMTILMAFRDQCADLTNYIVEYNLVRNGSYNIKNARYIGFYLFEKFFSVQGFSFVCFQVCLGLISFLILLVSAKRITRNVNFVLALYLIYPFGIESIQVKSLLASSISILGLTFLKDSVAGGVSTDSSRGDRKKQFGLLRFIILSVVATTIHFSLALILILGLVVYYFNDKIKENVFVFTILVTTLVYLNAIPKITNIVSRIFPVVNLKYISVWMERKVGLGIVIVISLMIIITFLTGYGKKMVFKEGLSQTKKDWESFLTMFSYTIWILLPFCMFDTTFNRLFRVYLFFMYCSIAIYLNGKMDKRLHKLIGVFMSICAAILFFFYDIFPFYESTLGALLKYNTLI